MIAPKIGPITGTQKYIPGPGNPISPHPASIINNFGPKSLAGFKAKPVRPPNVPPITATVKPIVIAPNPPFGAEVFFSSGYSHNYKH